MRETGFFPVYQAQLALQMQFAHENAYQLPPRQLILHTDFRHQGHPVAHGDKPFYRLQRGQFDVHVQRSFVPLERLYHLLPIRRGNDVRHERLCPQLPDADLLRLGQRMPRGNH